MKVAKLISVPLFAAALLLTGCESKVDVVGNVKFRGRPVTMGSVSLIAVDNINYTGEIGPDGSYKIKGVPAGPVKLGVTSMATVTPRQGGGAGNSRGRGGSAKTEAPPPPENPNPIPDSYSDPNTSGLTGTAGKGPIDIDING